MGSHRLQYVLIVGQILIVGVDVALALIPDAALERNNSERGNHTFLEIGDSIREGVSHFRT